MNNTISVIIPVYNVENYLKQCVDSILNQSYTDLEVFLVDDGSTDLSSQMCEEYARNDKRVRVFHKENNGQSGARNMGIDACSGDFIAFVDSDDWLHPKMYETLMESLKTNNADVACCNCFNVVDGIIDELEDSYSKECIIFDNKEDIFLHVFGVEPSIRPEIWNKLYKREVIADVRFKERQIHQDVFFDRMIFRNANVVVYNDIPLYYYRVNRPGSTNFRPINENRLPFFKEIEDMAAQLREENCPKAAVQVEKLAMGRAVFFYTHCTSPNVAKQFHEWFVHFYDNNDFTSLDNKWNMLLFRWLPGVYNTLFSLKHKS